MHNPLQRTGVKRVKLKFSGDIEVEFTDRDRAVAQVSEIAERGTYPVYVIYGPEGCGKTALFRQAREILEDEYGYHVIHANPLAESREEALAYTPSIRDLVREALKLFPEPYSRVADVAINAASLVMKRLRRPRVAVLMDDLFQAVGVDRAEAYTKTLLNLIEYPPGDYDRIVVLVASSEGVTRERVGRHDWATMMLLWNMPREGFEQLYNLLPGPKPSPEDAWALTGGNPKMLEELHVAGWDAGRIVGMLVESRGLTDFVKELDGASREILMRTVEDPDTIFEGLEDGHVKRLRDKLVEKNLLIKVPERQDYLWVDEPPPEKDPGLGIGRYYAWQTPLHREAIGKALEAARSG